MLKTIQVFKALFPSPLSSRSAVIVGRSDYKFTAKLNQAVDCIWKRFLKTKERIHTVRGKTHFKITKASAWTREKKNYRNALKTGEKFTFF